MHGEILIPKTVSLNAKTAMRADRNQQKSINGSAAVLCDYFYTKMEMAKMSMSGKACPSQPEAVAKDAFPEKMVTAIGSMSIMILIYLFIACLVYFLIIFCAIQLNKTTWFLSGIRHIKVVV